MKNPVEKIIFSKVPPETFLKMNCVIDFFTLISQRTNRQMRLAQLSIACSKSTMETVE